MFSPFVEIIRWLEIDIQNKVILLEKPGITTLSKSKGIILKKNRWRNLSHQKSRSVMKL